MEIEADIAIYGGSFNPPHKGHTLLIKYVLENTDLKKIIVVPVFSPPHKSNGDMLAFRHRFAMLSLLLRELVNKHQSERVKLSILEKQLPTPSYTYNTLEALKKSYPKQRITVMVGEDMYYTLPSWHAYQELLKQYSFIVFKRVHQTHSKNEMKKIVSRARTYFIDNPLWGYDSNNIRKLFKNYSKNKNKIITDQLENMLSVSVLNYILKYNLY